MKDDKRLLKAAKKIAKLERELDYTEDVEDVNNRIAALAEEFTPEELLRIDEIIQEKHLLY